LLAIGIIVGTVFYDMRGQEINNKFGMIFFSTIFLAFASMPALVLAFQQVRILYVEGARELNFVQLVDAETRVLQT
jgi:hypothetical protein